MRTEEIDLCETNLDEILEIFGINKKNLEEGVYEKIVEALKVDLLTRKLKVVAKKILGLMIEKEILNQEKIEKALEALDEEFEKQYTDNKDLEEKMAE
uniref:DUF2767 domain-containing protein n=1 Tax=Strongyloides venezuelensis TaxID=75913 RepID=A0A0K0FT13_STRVS